MPAVHADLTTRDVLAMSYASGRPIEEMATASQADRNRAATQLIDLALRELFSFRLMQTDPNLANYRYEPASGRIVLLDFGAAREFPPEFADRYRNLARAALEQDGAKVQGEMEGIGFFDAGTARDIRETVTAMFMAASEPLRAGGVFDFTDTRLLDDLREHAEGLAADRAALPVPPIDVLFLQRKFGGIYLLARRLRAKVDVRTLIEGYI